MSDQGYLVLEDGRCFQGRWRGGQEKAGEVVFNTSHSGYEEMATDPSYYSQILVTTAPMQGNYGEDQDVWESDRIWIHGFICLELQESSRDSSWQEKLDSHQVPILTDLDTRELTFHLRENGTTWGAMVKGLNQEESIARAKILIAEEQKKDSDWAFATTCKKPVNFKGDNPKGPKVAVIDLGSKKNIVRELRKRCREVQVFSSRCTEQEIRDWQPDGIMLSNGPGNPEDVVGAVETVRNLLGWRFIFGICMGHQILGLALGAKTYKLKFGHRGSNHPVKDDVLKQIYVTSQNHGYAVDEKSLGPEIKVTHRNLNDQTVSGIHCVDKKCMSVQFHPESHPGPHEGVLLFDEFVKQIQ